MFKNKNKVFTRKRNILAAAAVILCSGAAAACFLYFQPDHHDEPSPALLPTVKLQTPVEQVKPEYDVVVIGTDPEGVAAAVSAARNNLKTLLIEPRRDRTVLGGLMTEGWLNTLDMNYDHSKPGHRVLNKGLFSEWYKRLDGDSFDVNQAANAFYQLVQKEPNLSLVMNVKAVSPVVVREEGDRKGKRVSGVKLTGLNGGVRHIQAKEVIDAEQDADFAYQAGVGFTYGKEDLGYNHQAMAPTLVFQLTNVTPDVWHKLRSRLNKDGDAGTGANNNSAWGLKDMKDYKPNQPLRLKVRGFNIGREMGNKVLVNSLLMFVDPFNPVSVKNGRASAQKELPLILADLKQKYPEFADVQLGEVAPELYVRETRHMKGLYRLNITDLLENRDQWDRIALGSYPADNQSTGPGDAGHVTLAPVKYAIPFRSLVPAQMDGLLVVGRSASYDSLAHSSARIIPVGMAEGQAAGIAAGIAIHSDMTFRELARSKEKIEKIQQLANKQGMDLKSFTVKEQDYMKDEQYAGLKLAVRLGIAIGGYRNDALEDSYSKPTTGIHFINYLRAVMRQYPASLAIKDPAVFKTMEVKYGQKPITLQDAADILAAGEGAVLSKPMALYWLEQRGTMTIETLNTLKNKNELTESDAYMLVKDLVERKHGAISEGL
ncbi:FAD-dependent oxidoreductase [Paenibacillus sp. JX-17]|uniref:FAD-dependent oxidoreductase n=1 Tax=Paenibacillus lacisoli TaxID=3064525 RepID=A0ABT9CAR0_9BACL|nr:FAD-dependent oxidoreductase [Paenibacillus sp. JX-17]MDO7905633.1 FAD-dependent oxidoreductase [Paenibacillus sp. JX-17]